MNGLLLDTNVFLWAASDVARLPVKVADRIRHESGGIYVSLVSAWEIAIKVGLGKLELGKPVCELLDTPSIELLAITQSDIEAYSGLPFPSGGHRDPFDRMLVVQARARELTLMTSDQALRAYDVEIDLF